VNGEFRVGRWLVQPSLNTISQNGTSNRLEPKVMEVLVCLAQHRGEVVPKEKLLQTVWPDTFVSDDVLKRSVFELRRAFDDDARESRIVETIPKRGYRLVAPVEPLQPTSLSTAAVSGSGNSRRRWLAVAAVVTSALAGLALLLAMNVDGVRDRILGTKAPPEIHSLAVLPLENLSGDPSQDYFADGMTEELITEFSRVTSLKVISRTSVMHYKKTDKALPQIARELGVDAIVEGSAMRSGNHVRVTAQLIYAPTDTHLWAQSYEREMQDILTLQGEVAADIVAQMQVELGSSPHAAASPRPAVDARAYEAYLKGTYYWGKYTGDDLQRSLNSFQESIKFDPNFAGGYAGLGDAYLSLISYDLLPQSDLDKVESLEKKAMRLDPTLAETHESMGWVDIYRWDLPAADQEAHRALALNPNSPDVRLIALYTSQLRANLRPSLADLREIRQLDPISPTVVASLGFITLQSHMVDEAIEFCRDALDLDRDSVLANWCLGRVLLAKNQPERAMPVLQRAVDLGKVSYIRRDLARAQVATGDRGPAMRLIKEFRAQKDPRLFFDIAALYASLGNKQAALGWLEKAYTAHDRKFIFAGVDPTFWPLQSDSHLQDLLNRAIHSH
jgi:TolB-like protein/DNA-binding winged helix-turn-helix (wHTH) protein/Tfp pilus assembly protein PilF